MSMADYGPRLVVATDQQASASEVAATVLVSPYYAVSDADMSKALVPRAPMPAAHPRDCDVVAHNAQSLVPSDGTGRSVARLEREGEARNQSVDITVQGTQVQVGKRVYGNYRAEVEVTAGKENVSIRKSSSLTTALSCCDSTRCTSATPIDELSKSCMLLL